jgi:hypothetical protein
MEDLLDVGEPIIILINYMKEVRASAIDKKSLIDPSNAKYARWTLKIDQLIETWRVNLIEKPKKKAALIEGEMENEQSQ